MKRILIALMLLLTFTLLGCDTVPRTTVENRAYYEIDGTQLFDVYEIEALPNTDACYILVDRETDVMYLYTYTTEGYEGRGVGTTITLMVDNDGSPLLWAYYNRNK
jgi:uncharacterized protein YxeA